MSEWRPISDYPFPTEQDRYGPHNDLPDGRDVLVFSPEREERFSRTPAVIRVSRASWYEDKWEWWVGDAYDSELLVPTHWMPLPEAPKP